MNITKIENMSWEVYEAIISSYAHSEDELLYIFEYLYYTTTDKILKDMIESWAEENHYCIECGVEKSRFDYDERHDELDGEWYEHFIEYLCPICGF